MTAARTLERIIATTDFHSSLDQAAGLLTYLHEERPTSLIVDCGDFFEGTGFYQLGGGDIERQLLLAAYDVVAPGNHGWSHHFEPRLRELTVCANAVDDLTGEFLFRRLHTARIADRTVGITAVIGPQAFNAIPIDDRLSHRVIDPVQALRDLRARHGYIDDWILLSHSGFEEDRLLGAACPFLTVIFAGHCHSGHYGPEPVGNALIVKGAELGRGYASAAPTTTGWGAQSLQFGGSARLPKELEPIGHQIGEIRERLSAPLGPVIGRWQHCDLAPREVMDEVVTWLHAGPGSPAVVLNEAALRGVRVGEVLYLADLLAIEPFANELVHAPLPAAAGDLQVLLDHLTERAGPLITAPAVLPADTRAVLTTGYLAETFLSGRSHKAGLMLGGAVCHVLTGSAPAVQEGTTA